MRVILRIELWGSDFHDRPAITDIYEVVVPEPFQGGEFQLPGWGWLL